MSKFLIKDEITNRLGYKILIAGLSEAGKTAVKRLFFMKKQTGDIYDLAATVNYERLAVTIKGVPLTIVDLGGQKVFIKRFLNDFSPFVFSTVQIFIFVIDVADKSTKDNAIQYFASCLERIDYYSPESKLFVFLHKNDLVRYSPDYESVHDQLKEQFQQASTKAIHFFRTSIYKPNSVIDAFGRIFEVALPRIARSDYVDGKTIGEIEECAEGFTLMEMEGEVCPSCGTGNLVNYTEQELLCHSCGYKKLIQPVKDLQDNSSSEITTSDIAVSEKDSVKEFKPLVSKPGTVDSSGLAALKNLMKLVREGLTNGDQTLVDYDTVAVETDEGNAITQNNTSAKLHSAVKGDMTSSDDVLLYSKFLTSFYGIKKEKAVELVESGHSKTFETAAKAGVPIRLLLDVFLKYIPYLVKKELSFENLENNILELFLAFLKGLVKEDDIFHCLIYVAKEPEKPVERIVKEYVVKPRELIKQKDLPRLKHVEAELLDRIKTSELDNGITVLSKNENIGFTANKDGLNCRLTFYIGNQRLFDSLVSNTISVEELKYLLGFEASIPLESNYNEFVEEAAPIIHEKITSMFK